VSGDEDAEADSDDDEDPAKNRSRSRRSKSLPRNARNTSKSQSYVETYGIRVPGILEQRWLSITRVKLLSERLSAFTYELQLMDRQGSTTSPPHQDDPEASKPNPSDFSQTDVINMKQINRIINTLDTLVNQISQYLRSKNRNNYLALDQKRSNRAVNG